MTRIATLLGLFVTVAAWSQPQGADWPIVLSGTDLPAELTLPALEQASLVVVNAEGGEALLELDGGGTTIASLLGRSSAARAVVGAGGPQLIRIDSRYPAPGAQITVAIQSIPARAIALWQQVERAGLVGLDAAEKLSSLQSALRLSQPDTALRREINHARAKTLLGLGRIEAAVAQAESAVSDYEQAGEPLRAAGAEIDLARALLANRRREAAGAALTSAQERTSDPWIRAVVAGTRCRSRFDAGDLTQARDCMANANSVAKANGFSDLYASGLINLGVFESRLGNVDAGRRAYGEAIPLLQHPSNRSARAAALSNVAVLELRSGNLRRAAALFTEARVSAAELGNERLELISLTNLGGIAFELGDLDRANALFGEVLAARREGARASQLAIALNNVGEVQLALGNVDNALQRHQEALEIARDLEAHAIAIRAELGIAEALRRSGDAAALDRASAHAATALSQARVRGTPNLRARAEITLGALRAALGDAPAGEALLRQGIQTSARLYSRFTELRGHRYLVDSLHRRGDLAAALEQAELGMAVATRTRRELNVDQRTRFAEIISALNEQLVLLLAELRGDQAPELAWEAAQESRAATLLDVLQRPTQAGPGSRFQQTDDVARLREQLSYRLQAWFAENEGSPQDLPQAIRELERELAGAEAVAAAQAPLLPAAAAEGSLDELQSRLEPDTLFVEYFLGERQSLQWLVSAEGVRLNTLAGRAELEALATEAYRRLRAPGAGASEVLGELGAVLLPEEIARYSRLLVVADGALNYVPFAPLPFAGRTLLESVEIVYLPSARSAMVVRGETFKPTDPNVLVIADPVFGGRDRRLQSITDTVDTRPALRRLSLTRREAERIAQRLPAERVDVWTGFDATKARFLDADLSGVDIVHLATHGLFDSRWPELSGITLATRSTDGNSVDGFLALKDIYDLDLSADLVVLSGCDTALGETIRGEGVVGITRGFMYAGVPRILATLWQVRERATVDLMDAFYQGLLDEGRTVPAALRQAQLELMRRPGRQDPYFWAGVVLQGDWQ